MKNLKIFDTEEEANKILEDLKKDYPNALIYWSGENRPLILLKKESDADYDEDGDLFLTEEGEACRRDDPFLLYVEKNEED